MNAMKARKAARGRDIVRLSRIVSLAAIAREDANGTP